MVLDSIYDKLQKEGIFLAKDDVLGQPSMIGYEKKFRWNWLASQLNTFIVVTDFGHTLVTEEVLKDHLKASYAYAKANHKGWPIGLQSALAVISILYSSNIEEAAQSYCRKTKATLMVPITVNTQNQDAYYFDVNPTFGGLYYPHLRKWIKKLV
ncbi:hypothetical protein BKI52_10540 [marine bacterium AO1-C]|nr:hypothetical protein BKI52_10540 [marine bacterium AO1-C]